MFLTIIRKHYIDDYLDCANSDKEAIEIIQEVRRIQNVGGFDLLNLISNSKQIMNILSTNDVTCTYINLDFNEFSIQRGLGISLGAKSDTFYFKLHSKGLTDSKSL